MAGRDENGRQVTRRDSAGISKEGEYSGESILNIRMYLNSTRVVLYSRTVFSFFSIHFPPSPPLFSKYFTVMADAGGTSSGATRRGLEAG